VGNAVRAKSGVKGAVGIEPGHVEAGYNAIGDIRNQVLAVNLHGQALETGARGVAGIVIESRRHQAAGAERRIQGAGCQQGALLQRLQAWFESRPSPALDRARLTPAIPATQPWKLHLPLLYFQKAGLLTIAHENMG